MVKNHHLAVLKSLAGRKPTPPTFRKSISDAGWYQFTQWLEYFGKIWDKTVMAVNPNYTSQDCSNCGYRVKKSLSTRWRSLPEGLTHKCPRCHTEICRDTNAALNILKRGFEVLGIEFNSTQGHWETAGEPGTRRREFNRC